MYTTVEGMLNTVKTKLVEGHPFFLGDSAEEGNKFSRFVQKLDQVRGAARSPRPHPASRCCREADARVAGAGRRH